MLRGMTAAQTGKLRKYEPHPMAGFSAPAQFGQCNSVGVALGLEKTLQAVAFGSHPAMTLL